jgi:small redox-active disulfide protein 2
VVKKILGTGCAKCKATVDVVEKVSKELNLNPTILKVEDIQEIMKYDVLSTPAVVIDEVVKINGKVPTPNEIRGILTN